MNYSELTDSTLAELTKNGDCGAFEELVVRYHRAALGTAYRYVRSAQDAEDAVQEAYQKSVGEAAQYIVTALVL